MNTVTQITPRRQALILWAQKHRVTSAIRRYNVMERTIKDEQNSNPKIAATSFIVKMLAEVRALREGIIIADQLPTAMAPEVIKNTNIKLVHRLTSADDRELVGSTNLSLK